MTNEDHGWTQRKADRRWPTALESTLAERVVELERDLSVALDLLREWQRTELDAYDEDFVPWITQFSARLETLLAKHTEKT